MYALVGFWCEIEILHGHEQDTNGELLFFIKSNNETLFPNWQKEPWQNFEEASGYMRPERVNKWPNSMIDR
jgi:hypothetical protein